MIILRLKHEFQPSSRPQLKVAITDFETFVKVHPVIYAAKLIDEPNMEVKVYAVKEKVKLFGWLPLNFGYKVHVHNHGEVTKHYARILLIMRLYIFTYFSEDPGVLWVHEDIEVTNIPILTKIFWNVFRKVHVEAFDRLRKQIESPAAP
jgi:hypothetical protein